MYSPTLSKLNNGLTLITIQTQSHKLSFFQSYIKVGSAFEKPFLGSGISHFLEHIVAGNGYANISDEQCHKDIQKLGNMFNAYTTYTHTHYYINCHQQHEEKALEMLLGWSFQAKLNEKIFLQEKEIILREIESENASVSQRFYEACQSHFYQNNTFSYPILGHKELFLKLTHQDLKNFYLKFYQPQNAALCIASHQDHSKIKTQIEKKLSILPVYYKLKPKTIKKVPSQLPSTLTISQKTAWTRINIRIETCNYASEDMIIFDLISLIIGNGENSPLYKGCIENKNLGFSISCTHEVQQHSACYFEIRLISNKKNSKTAIKTIFECIQNTAQKKSLQKELKIAIQQKKSSLLLNNESPEDHCSLRAYSYLFTSQCYYPEIYLKKLKKITAEDIKKGLNFLKEDRASIVISYPEKIKKTEQKKLDDSQKGIHEKISLKNGHQLYFFDVKNTPHSYFEISQIGGLRNETITNNGISLLCADLIGKKSINKNKKELLGKFEEKGAQFYSQACANFYQHHLFCLNENFNELSHLFLESCFNFDICETEFKNCQDKQLEEIKERKNKWQHESFYRFYQNFFRNQIYGRSIIGEENSLKKLSHEQCLSFHQNSIKAAPLHILISGNLDKINKNDYISYFEALKTNEKKVKKVNKIERKKTLNYAKTHLDVAVLIIGFQAYSAKNTVEQLKLKLLQATLTGLTYPSGNIFERLRQEGYVYQSHSQHFLGLDESCFSIYALTQQSFLYKCKNIIFEELDKLKQKKVSSTTLENAKHQLRLFNEEIKLTHRSHASYMLKNNIFNPEVPFHDVIDNQLEQLNAADLQQSARQFVNPSIFYLSQSRCKDLETFSK